ncbi:MAG: PAS domain S-box protein [Herminiimonas sp.]|nr:PAS domain S-box protein [Herminiimonas sp.]
MPVIAALQNTTPADIDSTLKPMEYEAIFDNAMVGIVYSIDRNIIRCNRCFEELFGYGPGELNGRSLRVLYRSDDESEAIGRVGYQLMTRNGTYEDERFMVCKNGKPLWIKWSGRALDRHDPIKGALWTCVDISRRKSAEESLHFAYEELERKVLERTADLQRMNEALAAENERRKRSEELARIRQSELARMSRISTMGEMATTLAHQMGQPLSSTLNYLHGCLLRMHSGQFEQEAIITAIEHAILHTQQAGEIIQHVRQFVRKHEPERLALQNLNQHLVHCIGFLQFELNGEEVVVEMALQNDLPPVAFDRIEIEQVMLNLLKNAIEAMHSIAPESRRIRITSRRRGAFVYVDVCDSGPGVSMELRQKIFEPFFTTKNDGIGFGLAICRSIMESHGGKLRLSRTARGGTTFTFGLPA